MILVKKWKFPLCLFQDRIGLEIMSDDHLVKKALLEYKDIPFYIVAILDFFKGFTHNLLRGLPICLVQNWKLFICLFLDI